MPRAPDLAGRALDERYEVHEKLGEGTFGHVYRGVDRRLGRAVAVKVIKPWWAEDSDWVERFHREARLLARVNDPGVVQIFDIGHAEEGPYYIAELVDGESLAERLQDGPLQCEEARRIAERVCRALASAHRQGVMHCDIKPANVLLGSVGSVKVGDFGVARLAEASSQEPSATVAGTPRYMAPEQARGRPATPATDIYSVGVVLYEMLAGRPPFQSGSPVELALCHLQDPPPPLPAAIPSRLREVVSRALAKDPARRFADAGEMAEALGAARTDVAGPAVRARMPRAGNGARREGRATEASENPQELGAADTAIVALPPSIGAGASNDAGATIARTRPLSGGGAQDPPPRPPPRRGAARRRPLFVALACLAALAGAIGALLIAGGRARTTVPELRGLPLGGVVARARRLHVRPAFSRRYSERRKGIAVSQRPAPGTRVADGSTVHVVLSAGPPPVTVPSVVGESAAAAESLIAHGGLRYATSIVAAPETDPGVVVRQTPGPASSVPHGSTVTLSISETPRWRPLTTFSGVDNGHSVALRILGRRWRISYGMQYRGTCVFLVVCGGPHAEVANLETNSTFGGFDLQEGESETHVVNSGPGLYRIDVTGGRDSARWSMTVEDLY